MNSFTDGRRIRRSLLSAASSIFLSSGHITLSTPSTRLHTPRCLYASSCCMSGTNPPPRNRSRGLCTVRALPLTYSTPVTTVFSLFLTPSLDPDASSHMRQMLHARCRSRSDANAPHQSSAKPAWTIARHALFSASSPCPHSRTPLHTAWIATNTVLSRILALSGDRTQPIRAPIQLLKPWPSPAALS